ncbi:hypothetical protein [Halocatena marina]|uniref:Uncharacterized protein n=1 Tax=Halocatena marina TaxID=2934937 RepID=A0ABD5YKI8_9EURY|nr:hypothetical protein [Halocatena marina]
MFWTILVSAVLLVVAFIISGQYLLALSLVVPLLLFAYLVDNAAPLQ